MQEETKSMELAIFVLGCSNIHKKIKNFKNKEKSIRQNEEQVIVSAVIAICYIHITNQASM